MTPTSAAPASGYLTTGQAASLIGSTSNYVRELIHAGHLDAIDIGTGDRPRFRVAAESIDKFKTARAVTPSQKEAA
ncbi:excisionase family DNA-binding protein [Streptomyces sp. NPDC059828]|uniref:excisionase family DNA-binding protein n=1 Tax=Streptomyces sp. NPDC059828 TaxID=3346965 RepID=UPI003648675D